MGAGVLTRKMESDLDEDHSERGYISVSALYTSADTGCVDMAAACSTGAL